MLFCREGSLSMSRSMTGFGSAVAANEMYKLTVELKSVNNRFLEVMLHSPRILTPVETDIRSKIAQYAERGKIDVFIRLEADSEPQQVLKTDYSLAAAYVAAMRELSERLGLAVGVTAQDLLNLPGLFTMEKQEECPEDLKQLLDEALGEALTAFAAMRKLEGDRLAADLLSRREKISGIVAEIAELSQGVVAGYQARLHARISDLLDGVAVVDEARLANEVAYFADRACINEELVRLDSHLLQLDELLRVDKSVGRKLDFLLQEINREINTIGSKANDLAISKLVIDAKGELEKIREQVQNLE